LYKKTKKYTKQSYDKIMHTIWWTLAQTAGGTTEKQAERERETGTDIHNDRAHVSYGT